MRVCDKHNEVYNEQKGDCPRCSMRISDPLDVCVEDIVRVDDSRGSPVVSRGRVEQIGTQGTRDWIVYDLDNKALKIISMGCIVTKLEETYETARKH